MNKKLIAFLLSFTFIFTLIPLNVLAESATINEGYTVEESTITKDGLVLNKTANYNTKDGTVDITLEAYTTGVVKETTNTEPIDIVMVLDCTASLNDVVKIDGKEVTEFKVVQNAALSFVDAMVATGAQHRIAVVWFAAGLMDDCGFYTVCNEDGTENTENTKAIRDEINNQGTSGVTRHDAGVKKANEIFSSSLTTNKRVMLMFTDGVPGNCSYWTDGFADYHDFDSTTIATRTLQELAITKSAPINAAVYVVSFLYFGNKDMTNTSTWDPELERYVNWYGRYGEKTEAKCQELFEKTEVIGKAFINYMSSNFPLVDTMPTDMSVISNDLSSGNTQNGYVVNVTDINELSNEFTEVAQTIYPTYSLDDAAAVTDTLSQYFTNVSGVKVYKQNCTDGTVDNPTWGSRVDITDNVKITNDADTVSVEGFDFDENCVVPTAKDKGAKLVIKFTADAIEDFKGGNGVVTNDFASSGIIPKGETTPIANFPKPAVDVPMNYTFEASDSAIYISQEADLNDLVNFEDLKGLINDYVDVAIEITDDQGNVVGKATIDSEGDALVWDNTLDSVKPTATTTYTIKCTMTPTEDSQKDSTKVSPITWTDTATVFVYTPNIVENDGTVEKNTVVDLDDYVKMNEENPWVCEDATVLPEGDVPTLIFKYKELTSNPDVDVDNDVNSYTMDITRDFIVDKVFVDGVEISISKVGGYNTDKEKETKVFTISVPVDEIIIEDETPQAPAPTTTQPVITTTPTIVVEDETPLAPSVPTTKKPTPGTIVIEDETPLAGAPNTADPSQPMKWVALMAVAPVAIAFIKKSKEELDDETN